MQKIYLPFSFIVLLFFCQKINAQYVLEDAFPNLTFIKPVEFLAANDNSNRVFVLEQYGKIQMFDNSTATTTKATFLDLNSKIGITSGTNISELGLLGMAFHPNYASNGFFYVYYTRGAFTDPSWESVVARYKVNATNPNQADLSSEEILITFPQPFRNHNAGKLLFGQDGYLYIASGDGGSAGDPNNNAQNLGNYLGKILRIDVDKTQGNLKYAIPADNPFVSNASAKPEIFAYGLRNPWKFTLDTYTGNIWIAEVGQDLYDEIDILEKGKNYGWKIMEADQCYSPSTNCSKTGLTLPIWTHNLVNGNRSITGGYVYRGDFIPSLQNKYIYGDYKSGNIYALTYQNGIATNQFLLNASGKISSFGMDKDREVYVCLHREEVNISNLSSRIYKLKDPTVTALEDEMSKTLQLKVSPNPTNQDSKIEFNLLKPAKISIELWNTAAQQVKTYFYEQQLGEGKHNFKLSNIDLKAGIYFLHFKMDSYLRTVRIIKQ